MSGVWEAKREAGRERERETERREEGREGGREGVPVPEAAAKTRLSTRWN